MYRTCGRRPRNMITGSSIQIRAQDFCANNKLMMNDINAKVFESLYSIKCIPDVFKCPYIKKENKMSMLQSFQRATEGNCARNWLTQGITEPLIFTKDRIFIHPFDACPKKFLCFQVYPDGKVELALTLEEPRITS